MPEENRLYRKCSTWKRKMPFKWVICREGLTLTQCELTMSMNCINCKDNLSCKKMIWIYDNVRSLISVVIILILQKIAEKKQMSRCWSTGQEVLRTWLQIEKWMWSFLIKMSEAFVGAQVITFGLIFLTTWKITVWMRFQINWRIQERTAD